jgi:hypothetical protein
LGSIAPTFVRRISRWDKQADKIFGFCHIARLAILTDPDVEQLSAPESESALLGVCSAF